MYVRSRRRFLLEAAGVVGLAAGGGILVGCSSDPASSSGSGASADLTPIRLQASWINDAQNIGYYVADSKGFYTENGIALDYLPGGFDVIPEASLLAGTADIAMTTPETTVKSIVEDGAPFRIIGAQFQKSPNAVISLAGSGITTVADLVGKTIGVPDVNLLTLEAVCAANKVDIADINVVPYQADPTALIAGEIDATLDFATDAPFTIKQAGAEAEFFLLADVGFSIFMNTLVVTEETLATQRDALAAFLRASRMGWDENFTNVETYPAEFASTWFAETGRSVENEVYYNTAQKPLIQTPAGIFSMTPESVSANIEAMRAIGVEASPDVFVTDLVDEL